MHWLFPDFRFQWLVDEIRRNLPKELDFREEASNQERFSKLFLHLDYVMAPKVHWELTTPRVLTMEYCEGSKVNDLDYIRRHGINVDDVSDACVFGYERKTQREREKSEVYRLFQISWKLGRMYSEMIFLRGFIHCDPHPGNILVRKGSKGKAEIIMLDHGLYRVSHQ